MKPLKFFKILSLSFLLSLGMSTGLKASPVEAAPQGPAFQTMTVIFNLGMCGALSILDLDTGFENPATAMLLQVKDFLTKQKEWESGKTYRIDLEMKDGQLSLKQAKTPEPTQPVFPSADL